jgi:hypothetical protein
MVHNDENVLPEDIVIESILAVATLVGMISLMRTSLGR